MAQIGANARGYRRSTRRARPDIMARRQRHHRRYRARHGRRAEPEPARRPDRGERTRALVDRQVDMMHHPVMSPAELRRCRSTATRRRARWSGCSPGSALGTAVAFGRGGTPHRLRQPHEIPPRSTAYRSSRRSRRRTRAKSTARPAREHRSAAGAAPQAAPPPRRPSASSWSPWKGCGADPFPGARWFSSRPRRARERAQWSPTWRSPWPRGGTRLLAVDADPAGRLSSLLLPDGTSGDGFARWSRVRWRAADGIRRSPAHPRDQRPPGGCATTERTTGVAYAKAVGALLAEATDHYDVVLVDSDACSRRPPPRRSSSPAMPRHRRRLAGPGPGPPGHGRPPRPDRLRGARLRLQRARGFEPARPPATPTARRRPRQRLRPAVEGTRHLDHSRCAARGRRSVRSSRRSGTGQILRVALVAIPAAQLVANRGPSAVRQSRYGTVAAPPSLTVRVLVVPTGLSFRRRRPGGNAGSGRLLVVYGRLLGSLLAGYLMFDKAFAYLLPGALLYIGEMLLGLGVVGVRRHRLSAGATARRATPSLLTLFVLWGAVRSVSGVRAYGLDAVRDAALWYYGLFAFLAVATLARTPQLVERWLTRLRALGPWLLLWLPVAVLLTPVTGQGAVGARVLPCRSSRTSRGTRPSPRSSSSGTWCCSRNRSVPDGGRAGAGPHCWSSRSPPRRTGAACSGRSQARRWGWCSCGSGCS